MAPMPTLCPVPATDNLNNNFGISTQLVRTSLSAVTCCAVLAKPREANDARDDFLILGGNTATESVKHAQTSRGH